MNDLSRQRTKLKAFQLQPDKQRRYYVQSSDQAVLVRRTVRNPDNPFHEGLTEVRRSGADKSRRSCLGAAWNGSPHHSVVAVDLRTRASEAERIKYENGLAKEGRLLDQQLDNYLRRLDNGKG
jgi:hypothetical protein